MTETPKKTTLAETDVKSRRGGLGRRAFLLGAFGGSTALAGCVTTSITDSDTGRYADPVGRGRGRNCTDADGGAYADPVGRGRRC